MAPTDSAQWLQDLESDDERLVIRALHRSCPCSGSSALYEEFMPILARFKHDHRLEVRKVAIHLEVDALQRLAIEDERAAGWARNSPRQRRVGGREVRRSDIRHGFGSR